MTTPEETNPALKEYVACVARSLNRLLPKEQRTKIKVLHDDEIHQAVALLNGSIIVYSGMLKPSIKPGELATVLAHEIGHVLNHDAAKHIGYVVGMTGLTIGSAMIMAYLPDPAYLGEEYLGGSEYSQGSTQKPRTVFSKTDKKVFNQLVKQQMAATPVDSRLREVSADRRGIFLMAKAGFDPREAFQFWNKQPTASTEGEEPAFYATHPTDELRVYRIRKLLPRASKLYRRARAQGLAPHCYPMMVTRP